MAPVRSYTNWNSRTTDEEEQIEPYRKYFFICEGANTETWYFKKLIDIRKELNIHPLIDIRLLEKTGINPKKNSAIGELAKNIGIAIEQEKKINEDIHQCKGQITCNIGRIIDEIRKDDGKECKLK